MAGHEGARCNLGCMEQAVKHWTIAASAGDYNAMRDLLIAFNQGLTSRNAIDATLIVYNKSCAEMEVTQETLLYVLTSLELVQDEEKANKIMLE